jgi:hemolysin III
MDTMSSLSRYSKGEEIANSITHGVGTALSIAGLAILTAFASVFGTVWHIVSCSIYGTTLILLYGASTLYHAIQHPRAKAILRTFDHSAIFLLIAGTYTPFTLVNLRGPWGWSLFCVIWGCAILGIAINSFLMKKSSIVAVVFYIAMGWAAAIGIKPLLSSVAPGGLILLLIGGLFYSIGTIFYVSRRLRYHHAIWHGFVLAGSIFHFFTILFYVIPLAA